MDGLLVDVLADSVGFFGEDGIDGSDASISRCNKGHGMCGYKRLDLQHSF